MLQRMPLGSACSRLLACNKKVSRNTMGRSSCKDMVKGKKELVEGVMGVYFPGDRPGCGAAHGGRHGGLIHDLLLAWFAADQCGYCEAHGVHGKPG